MSLSNLPFFKFYPQKTRASGEARVGQEPDVALALTPDLQTRQLKGSVRRMTE